VCLWAAWAGVRLFGLERGYPFVPLLAYTPYVAAGAIIPLVVAVAVRRWVAASVAFAVLTLFAAFVLPRAFSDDGNGPARGTPLRVMTANIELGGADLEGLAELVRRNRIDALSVQELTPAAVRALRRTRLDKMLSERVLAPAPRSTGGGLYARYRLLRRGKLGRGSTTFEMPSARMRVPSVGAVELVAVHANPPEDGSATADWQSDLRALPRADPDGPLRILPGDFNATLDHDELREVIDSGYTDAADEAGKGLIPTWPTGRRIPPPLTIDHVLADERIGVRDVSIHSLEGSDHRPVSAELVLPRRE
jgi:endonuclease/exonuclease/phosphatase (EEP) superfamily protein YafD